MPDTPRPLYNLGSINIDHVYRVPHLVRPGETLASTGYQQVLGGKGANQSLAMALAGGRVEHWGRLGLSDDWALRQLTDAGVGAEAVDLVDEPSGHALIQVDDQAENAIILYPGANHGFANADIDTRIDNADPSGWLLLQNETNGLARAMEQAHARGLSIAFNPAPMHAAVNELPLSACQLLFVNRGEAAALVNLSEDSDADALLMALGERLPGVELVLTLGGDGVCYQHGDTRLVLPAYRVEARDTTAAGDTFIGHFMAARLAGSDVETCLRRASAASAICVQREGAAPSIPDAHAVDKALAEWPALSLTRH
ncbi:ribokinase [Onishia taeanensis]|uniref:Ribokinase n=1 Tax=Onishia taeanensis TaxID=284577 RepID=A0A328XWZ3_9GAMM|nr:ribokinase [Halomonas taeanensis]RAR60291.1 ribokinase [Halomonas taeanensis]